MNDNQKEISRLSRTVTSAQNVAGWAIAFLLCVIMLLLAISLPLLRGLICAAIAIGTTIMVSKEAWKAVDAPPGIDRLHRERATSTAFLGVILSMWTILSSSNQVTPLVIVTVLVGATYWWTIKRTGKWISLGETPPKRIGTYAFVKQAIAQACEIGEDIAARRKAARSSKNQNG